jgi:hypothetical protein
MRRLTKIVHNELAQVLTPGNIAIDATAGNGHDTLFLAKQVGPAGSVFSLDMQSQALAKTAHRLKEQGYKNVTLLQADHANLKDVIPIEFHGKIAAITFNLGYLPGGEKTFVTQSVSTVTAIDQSLDLLRSKGLLTIVAYTGHPGGMEETTAVRTFLAGVNSPRYTVDEISTNDERTFSPVLFTILKH